MEAEVQHLLVSYGSPPEITDKLKYYFETSFFPRHQYFWGVQLVLFYKTLGVETEMFVIGLTFRHFIAQLEPNYSAAPMDIPI